MKLILKKILYFINGFLPKEIEDQNHLDFLLPDNKPKN